jgi:pimeloyl-ACP methyl ester carboxylesterase
VAGAISFTLILITLNLKPGRTSGMNSRVWRLLLVFVALIGLIGLSWVGVAQSGDPVVAEVASPLPLESDGGGEYLIARPNEPNGTLFVFYPGGKVPPRAYEHWARALAALGVTVAIPIMPLDLAILGIYRASAVREALLAKGWRAKRFVVGGHSLGGAMAGWYSSWLPVDGLVFMAAYPPWSIADKKFPVLSIAAELDGLATLEKVRASLPNLPPSTQLEVVPGGVHAFFGRYGAQADDGQPTTSREVFEAAVLEKLSVFLEKIRR